VILLSVDHTLLYLTAAPSVAGRYHFRGRRMFDGLAQHTATTTVAHFVASRDSERIPPYDEQDVVTLESVSQAAPDIIYMEGGLHGGTEGPWRFPRMALEDLIRAGTVVVVADVDLNTAMQFGSVYQEAGSLLGAQFVYKSDADREPVHLADLESNYRSHRSLIVDPADMLVADWLLPSYDGVSRVMVALPVLLDTFDSVLATGNSHSTGTMQGDLWIDRITVTPWASVRGLGAGYVVFVAGAVSSDGITDLFPDNIKWMANLTDLLVREASRDINRRSTGSPSEARRQGAVELAELLMEDESQILEFKETLRINVRTGQLDKRMEHEVVKTVAGFLNADGGTLVVGVSDAAREVVGLDRDTNTLKRKDLDGLEQFIRGLLAHSVGADTSTQVAVSFPEQDGKRACVIVVPRGSRPIFIDAGDMYVRDGNGTRKLVGDEVLNFVRDRFG
jgi:Putative DNA-binding domain